MEDNTNIQKIAEDVYQKFNPLSVFLYGSRSRNDFNMDSDYEIGIIQNKQGGIKRVDLNQFVNRENIHIYPFVKGELENYTLNTPFQKQIYLYELIKTGKTLAGDRLIENICIPRIESIHLIERLGFDSGQALSSIFAYRQKDMMNASTEFMKSCLFSTRILEIFKLKKFPLTFKEIYELSTNLDLDEYQEVVDIAYELRLTRAAPREDLLYKNISYINNFIKEQIISDYKASNNRTFIYD